ncbi:hypothetical protein MY3296_009440 [Beauveria thailandica]
MESAKETLHKVVKPSGRTTGQQSKPGLEGELSNKTTRTDELVASYSASGKLKGKNAVITGGDSGIGRAVAILFAMEGAKVAIVYLPAEEQDAQHTKAQVEENGGEILLLASDLSHAVNCRDVASRIGSAMGKVDILVNNAATRNVQGHISDLSEEQWSTTFRVNVDSYFFLTKALLPYMEKGGSIINSASVDSYIGVPSRIDYTTSKGAVVAFTRALSNDVIKNGLRANAVASGPTWTPLMASGVDKAGQQGHGLGNSTAMGRFGQPVEVATSYVFLASRDSQFMSGQTLHPNGGIVVNG